MFHVVMLTPIGARRTPQPLGAVDAMIVAAWLRQTSCGEDVNLVPEVAARKVLPVHLEVPGETKLPLWWPEWWLRQVPKN
jgi:hypothetical protein